jgi:hypothetical protein
MEHLNSYQIKKTQMCKDIKTKGVKGKEFGPQAEVIVTEIAPEPVLATMNLVAWRTVSASWQLSPLPL